MRQAVEIAWKAKDFGNVVDLYKRHFNQLTSAEMKRYEISLKKISAEPTM